MNYKHRLKKSFWLRNCEKVVSVNEGNHSILVAVVIQTDSSKKVRNSCVIERLDYFATAKMFCFCKESFVIELRNISSFFLTIKTLANQANYLSLKANEHTRLTSNNLGGESTGCGALPLYIYLSLYTSRTSAFIVHFQQARQDDLRIGYGYCFLYLWFDKW